MMMNLKFITNVWLKSKFNRKNKLILFCFIYPALACLVRLNVDFNLPPWIVEVTELEKKLFDIIYIFAPGIFLILTLCSASITKKIVLAVIYVCVGMPIVVFSTMAIIIFEATAVGFLVVLIGCCLGLALQSKTLGCKR